MVNALTIQLERESRIFADMARARWTPEVFNSEALKFLDRRSKFIAGTITRSMSSSGKLKRRTGALARDIMGRSELIGGAPAMRVGVLRGPALKYAGPQEEGTQGRNPASPYKTIRPVRAKALAVPTGEALTPAGVARYAGPREFPKPLRFIPARAGKRSTGMIGFLVIDETKALKVRNTGTASANRIKRGTASFGDSFNDGKIAYILLSKVDLMPRYYLRDGFNAELPGVVRDIGVVVKQILISGRSQFTR